MKFFGDTNPNPGVTPLFVFECELTSPGPSELFVHRKAADEDEARKLVQVDHPASTIMAVKQGRYWGTRHTADDGTVTEVGVS